MSEDRKSSRWKPGQSGNPQGRPRGNNSAASLRARLGKDLDGIVTKLVDLAKAGDVQAARTLLERCMPALKPVDQPVAMQLPEGAGLAAQGEAVLRAAAAGSLSPSQVAQMIGALASLAKLREVDELERRIAALEAASGGKA